MTGKYLGFLKENKALWEGFSPCFVVNKKQLQQTVETIKELLPGEIVYSHKTNPHHAITDIARENGCGLLLSSVEELEDLAERGAIDKGKVIFQSPSLTKDQYLKIRSFGVSRFVVDSWEQLEVVTSLTSGDSNQIELLVRINTGVKVENPELPYSSDSFLGFPMEEAIKVFEHLRELREKGSIKLGLHNHLLSQNTHLEVWEKNMEAISLFVEELKDSSTKLDIVDFGGGYPIKYHEDVPTLEEISKIICTAMERIKKSYPNIHFIFEPGRKVIGESVTLISQVAHTKKFTESNVAILNCSVYNASMDTLVVKLCLCGEKISNEENKTLHYTIRGSTPDSLDIFADKVFLPELKSGDYIAFFHAGAYSFSSDFISLKKPDCIVI